MTSGLEMTLAEAEGLMNVGWSVRRSAPLQRLVPLWLVQASEEQARLGVYFLALGLLLQVPGARTYQWVGDANGVDRLGELVAGAPPARVRALLAAALERLDAGGLLAQVPGWTGDRRRTLPPTWRALLNRYGRLRNGLLNVIAECLDELIVRPALKRIGAGPTEAAMLITRGIPAAVTGGALSRNGKKETCL